MRSVIQDAVSRLSKNEACVLATVVRTRGMTPQKAGAKQLFRKDGSSLGTLGGGCVEGDIWFYAKEILREDGGPQLRDYKLNADMAAQDGLVCGGTMSLFLDPLYEDSTFPEFAAEVLRACESGPPVALATIVASEQDNGVLGQKLLVREDGSTVGTLGAAPLDRQAIKIGRKIAPFGSQEYLSHQGIDVYVEGFTTAPTLVVMGGGHIGKAVYELAIGLGFRVVIVDDREDFSNPQRFPLAWKTLTTGFESAFENLKLNDNSFILVATRGHRYDDIATSAALATPARYIGLLGSRRKNLLIFRDLYERGVSLDRLQEIHAPVGLDIGALTPEELAVSIMAEMIMEIRGGAGGALKMTRDELLNQVQKVAE